MSKFISWTKKNARFSRFLLPNLGYLASLFFAWSLAELWRIGSFESQTVDWIIVSLGVFFITAAATQYAAAKFRSNMEKIGAVSNLRLTAGDEKSVVRVAAKNRLWFKKGNRGSLWRRSSDRAKSRQCSNL